MASPEDPSTSVASYWNTKYRSTVYGYDPEPPLRAALAHFGPVAGKRLLDLGCGTGVAAVFFAARGARVTAVDLSEVAIQKLRDACAAPDAERIGDIRAEVCSALQIDSLGPFDLVFGSMILHHIEPFAVFADVLARATAPGGKAFFHENSARSPLLIWFRTHLVGRYGIPKYGDADEFPLQPAEVDLLRPAFDVQIDIPELRLFRMISTYLLRRRLTPLTLALDRWFYKLGFLNQYSYSQYLRLTRGSWPG